MSRLTILLMMFVCSFQCFASEWATQTLHKMTLDEKIGQLFIVGAYPNQVDATSEGQTEPCLEYVENMIRDYHAGGVLFKFFWDPLQQAQLASHFQKMSKIPLFTAQDLEWGLTQRLPSALRFPKNLTLGAVKNDQLIYDLGREIGKQCHIVGINFNLAPVMDVNCNPDNPVINDRSFGSHQDSVARKGAMLLTGLQDEGVLACAKHFPGHGDTSVDSHYALPVITQDRERLEQIELYPFRQAIKAGVRSIMTAHLYVPALDVSENKPSSLSKQIVTSLLKGEMHFEGLVITDDLLMKAVSQNRQPGQLALEAFLAGNDLLISSKDIAEGFNEIKKAVQDGRITVEDLDSRVLKILMQKQWIFDHMILRDGEIGGDLDWMQLSSTHAKNLKNELYRQAITLLYNSNGIVPLSEPNRLSYIQIGGKGNCPFYTSLKGEKPVSLHYLPVISTKRQQNEILQNVKEADFVVVALFDMNKFSKQNWGISADTLPFLEQLFAERKNAILVVFGNPYSLKLFGTGNPIIMAYEDDPDAQAAAAEVILGKSQPAGDLPIHPVPHK